MRAAQLLLDLVSLRGPRAPTPPRFVTKVTERVSDRARAVRVEIRPGGEVLLVIPRRASLRGARRFLEAQRPWIERQLERQRLRPPAGLRGRGAPLPAVVL